MKRPSKLSKDAAEYVDYLEGKLNKFDVDSMEANAYLAFQKTIDDITNLLLSDHEYTDPVTLEKKKAAVIDWDSMVDKDDKFVDRVSKFMDKLPEWSEKAKSMYESLSKESLDKVEVRHANTLSNFRNKS